MSSDAEDLPEPQYTDGNRAFIQAFLARGTLTFKQAKPLIAKILTIQNGVATRARDITQQDFDSFIASAARALSSFDYGIRAASHQATGERIWAIINFTSDPLTQLATTRTADELAFIKRVLDLMFETYNTKRNEIMAFRQFEALKVAKAPPASSQARRNRQSQGGDEDEDEDGPVAVRPKDNSITITQAEILLAELVTEGWFEESPNKFITLSPRALMELKGWLIATYNDEDAEEGEWQRIKTCAACKDIVTVGERCEDRECNTRVHDICVDNYFAMAARRAGGASSQAGRKCGGCGGEWRGRAFVGEKVITTKPDWGRGSGKNRPSGSGSRRHVQEEEEQEEDEEEEEDVEEPNGVGGEEDAEGEEEEEEDDDDDE